MGLREAAEAARIDRQDERDEKTRRDAEARRRKEMEKRAQVQDRAYEAADRFGFVIEKMVWTTPPAPKGYTNLPVLLVCSDDGVWLEFRDYKQYATSKPESQFCVVDKCPSCDLWVHRSGWSTDLAGIGDSLARDSAVPSHHLRVHGTEAP